MAILRFLLLLLKFISMILKIAVLTSVWEVSILCFTISEAWSLPLWSFILSIILSPVSPTWLSRQDGSVQLTSYIRSCWCLELVLSFTGKHELILLPWKWFLTLYALVKVYWHIFSSILINWNLYLFDMVTVNGEFYHYYLNSFHLLMKSF